jgi:hypothetical protein
MPDHRSEPPVADIRLLFPRWIRRLLLCLGIFVLYSQLVSAGLTAVYRYSPWEPSFVDGHDPEIFEPGTYTLLQPPEGIGSAADLRAVGWRIELSPIRYAAWAVLAPVLGSAALFFAWAARAGWLSRCMLFLGSCVGITAAIYIKIYEFEEGAIGWAFSAGTMTDMLPPNPPHPIYGYAELVGSLFLPIALYLAIALFLLGSAGWMVVRWSSGAIRRRHSP